MTFIPPAAALSPMAKESTESRSPRRRASRGSMREEAFLSQREGECRGEVSLRFPCPMPCRQSHTPKKRRSMGENRSARCAGKTATSRRPAKRNSSIMRKASIVSRSRADGRPILSRTFYL